MEQRKAGEGTEGPTWREVAEGDFKRYLRKRPLIRWHLNKVLKEMKELPRLIFFFLRNRHRTLQMSV